MIKVLVVDDSPFSQKILAEILESEPDISVEGFACSGEEALSFLSLRKVDVVTMDILMKGMDGFEATRRIMESETPVPIVIVSSWWNPVEVEKTFEAMAAGAVAILGKAENTPERREEYGRELIGAVRNAAGARVSRLRKKTLPPPRKWIRPLVERVPEVVVAGASTGGPQALVAFLSALPEDFPCPVVIVQHMGEEFTAGFTHWLDGKSSLRVKMAQDGELLSPGRVFIAPGGTHLEFRGRSMLKLVGGQPENMACPSVSRLFRSAVRGYGKNTAALLFSGMGSDGVEEMRMLRELGAVTMIQDRDSSVVWGMPGEAAKIDAADFIAPPSELAEILAVLVSGKGRLRHTEPAERV